MVSMDLGLEMISFRSILRMGLLILECLAKTMQEIGTTLLRRKLGGLRLPIPLYCWSNSEADKDQRQWRQRTKDLQKIKGSSVRRRQPLALFTTIMLIMKLKCNIINSSSSNNTIWCTNLVQLSLWNRRSYSITIKILPSSSNIIKQ